MPDEFQAQPNPLPPAKPAPYERYSEISFRKPEGRGPSRLWVTIALSLAVIVAGIIAAITLNRLI